MQHANRITKLENKISVDHKSGLESPVQLSTTSRFLFSEVDFLDTRWPNGQGSRQAVCPVKCYFRKCKVLVVKYK